MKPLKSIILFFSFLVVVITTQTILIAQPVGGDLSGSLPNPTVAKIQGQSVSTTAPTTGQILKWNGSSYLPSADGLLLPYSASASLSGTTINLFKIDQTNSAYTPHMVLLLNSGSGSNFHSTNRGSGKCASFYQGNSTNANNAVEVTAAGSGFAIYSMMQGTGSAGYFANSNTTSSAHVLKAEVYGSGSAIWANAPSASGKAASFSISNPANASNCLTASTSGTGSAIYGLSSSGTGVGVYGTSSSGTGVYGSSTTGYAVYSNGNAFKATGGNTWTIPSDARLKKKHNLFHRWAFGY